MPHMHVTSACDISSCGEQTARGMPEGAPRDFLDVWKETPAETEAQKFVKKLSLADKRALMVVEGERS